MTKKKSRVFKVFDDIVNSGTKYRIIYADPPWKYDSYRNGDDDATTAKRVNIAAAHGMTPYKGMTIEAIKDLPVKDITDTDAILFLWITYPCLNWLPEVLEAWNFTYTTVGFTWLKKNKNDIGFFTGLGKYTRANAEICIIAKKGNGCKVINHAIPQLHVSPVSSHSKKPDAIRRKIEKLLGLKHVGNDNNNNDIPKIELFARRRYEGWDVFGNDKMLEYGDLLDYMVNTEMAKDNVA